MSNPSSPTSLCAITTSGKKLLMAATDLFQGGRSSARLRASRPCFDGVTLRLRRDRSWRVVMDRIVMLLVAVGVGVVAVGQWSFPALSQQVGDPPRLLGWKLPLTSGEPAPLGLTLRGRADDAVVMITGLVPGMALSTGSKIGVDTWQVSCNGSSKRWIVPPTDFVGMVDLIAELHQPIGRLQIVSGLNSSGKPQFRPRAPQVRRSTRTEQLCRRGTGRA
jgi:hypothetical protein